jgi:hypothetical protein
VYKILLVLLILLLPLIASGQQVDPTRPFGALASSPFSSSEKKGGLVLQSIIQSQQLKKALINGKMLMVGDVYKGFELIAINSKGVVLHSPQGRMELSLFSGVIAK